MTTASRKQVAKRKNTTVPNKDNALQKSFVYAEIYALCCPDSGEVRYIGKANDSAKRYVSHMKESRRKYPVYYWRDSLLAKGKSPQLRVLASCIGDWREVERHLIAQYKAGGARLLNIAEGGDEPYCSREQRSMNASKINADRNSDPKKKRLHQIRLQVISLLKHGVGSKEALDVFQFCAETRPDLFGSWKRYLA